MPTQTSLTENRATRYACVWRWRARRTGPSAGTLYLDLREAAGAAPEFAFQLPGEPRPMTTSMEGWLRGLRGRSDVWECRHHRGFHTRATASAP